ncbi:ATPase [Lipomyces oligophaga]|uniref:ATPase n=1 Tax=Lipomyces oligophaga TaxID=45792 RepID=UPI0034CEDC2C
MIAIAARSARVSARRFITPIAVRCYAPEGATGSVRSGGEKSSDSFNKREKANEDFFVRQVEAEKLKALREALKKQREHLDAIETHLDEIEKK